MKTLHKFNPVRLAFIRDTDRRSSRPRCAVRPPAGGPELLDVGCGGGLLCEPLARLGADVTGIDPAPDQCRSRAASCRASRASPVDVPAGDRRGLVAEGQRFDVVLAMEVVEHVADVELFVETCCEPVKPGGLLFMATLNRTLRALRWRSSARNTCSAGCPRHPSMGQVRHPRRTRRDAIAHGGLELFEEKGVVYNPLDGRWRLSSDLAVNYMVCAAAQGAR